MAATIVGIPLAIVWFFGVGSWWADHYYHKLRCEVDARTLRFRKGVLVQVEKTIPLENIQDVTFIEGPILRKFNLTTLKFETAGHSAGLAADMQLTGIIDAHVFRQRILEAREALRVQGGGGGAQTRAVPETSATDLPPAPHPDHAAVLERIASRLDEIAALLRDRG
ncbi:MAG: PH domain-containing protein [Phycisphaerales bacterium]|nr:MAG: PH domain-containing protein [Phycisphaerales bacterium]